MTISFCFVSTNPIPDEEMKPTEDLSSTSSTVTGRHAKALIAVSAYGASVALNKTRQRPVSAKMASLQGEVKNTQVLVLAWNTEVAAASVSSLLALFIISLLGRCVRLGRKTLHTVDVTQQRSDWL